MADCFALVFLLKEYVNLLKPETFKFKLYNFLEKIYIYKEIKMLLKYRLYLIDNATLIAKRLFLNIKNYI